MFTRTLRILFVAAAALGAAIAARPALAVDVAPGVQVHGYLQNRFYEASGANPEFRIERLDLTAIAALPNDSNATVNVYYHTWAPTNPVYVESAYYDTPFGPGRLRVGKGRRLTFGITPAYPNRRTSNYGLVSEALTQDRIQGAQYVWQNSRWSLGGSLHTAYRLGVRNIGEIPGDDPRSLATPTQSAFAVPHLTLREAPLSQKLQISGRAGMNVVKGLNVGFSGSYASLDNRDLANLKGSGTDVALRPRNPITGVFPTVPLGADFTNQSMAQYGADLTWQLPYGFLTQGELYRSRVSNLDYGVWSALVGWQAPFGWKFYTRYAEQNMDTPRTNNPLSWDTQQWNFSIVQPLRKDLWLQYEAELNNELTDTGAHVKNNIAFVELYVGF